MFEQLSVAEERYQAINDKLMDPNVVSDPKPVSYTHLDVYKRQTQNSMRS